MNAQNASTLQMFQSLTDKRKSHLSKKVYPVSLQLHSESTQRNLAICKKTSRGKLSRRSLATIAKKTTSKQRKNVVLSEKGLQLLAVITPPIYNQLS